MTTYGAYNAGLPCKNPSCKSNGKPHPNCRCYGSYAKGGGVGAFCEEDRAHASDCEYFADGGAVEIDPSEVIVDEAPSTEALSTEPLEEIPPDEVEIDRQPTGLEEGIPADEVVIDGTPEAIPDGLMGEIESNPDARAGQKIKPQDIAAMDKRYEDTFAVGSMLTGAGAAGVANKAAAAAAEYANLGKVGSSILQGAISNGLIAATDETSKMFLGADQDHPVAAILASAGLGGVLGPIGYKVGSVAANKLKAIKDTKIGSAAASFLAGVGTAANNKSPEARAGIHQALGGGQFDQSAFEAGEAFFRRVLGAPQAAAASIGAYEGARRGYHEDGLGGAVEEGLKGGAKGFAIGKALGLSAKLTTPVIIKILSASNTTGMLDALNHYEKVANGANHVDKAVEGLFSGVAKGGVLGISALESDKNREALEEWINGGGVGSDVQQSIYDMHAPEIPGFAEGGDVKSSPRPEKSGDGVANHFPEQNVIMQTAKARASNYLNSLRPSENQPKLAFDDEPDNRQQKKAYRRALDVAASPLGVLEKVRKGTVEADDIKHLNAMFPEVVGLLQSKISEKISKSQISGKKPSYKVRQGLSMLLGAPLSGEMTPQNIQAAQAVFAQAGQQPGPSQPSPQKGNTSKLSKSNQAYMTDDQARMARQQRPS